MEIEGIITPSLSSRGAFTNTNGVDVGSTWVDRVPVLRLPGLDSSHRHLSSGPWKSCQSEKCGGGLGGVSGEVTHSWVSLKKCAREVWISERKGG